MGRLSILPFHGRTHLPGGSDPIPGLTSGPVDASWASLVGDQSLGTGSGSTFVFDTADSGTLFHTNDASVFELRLSTFNGIKILQPGVYLVHWGLSAAKTSDAAAPNVWLEIVAGSSFTSTYVAYRDLGQTSKYGVLVPGAANSLTSYHDMQEALVLIADVAADRYVGMGWTRRNNTTVSITICQQMISVVRLSDAVPVGDGWSGI